MRDGIRRRHAVLSRHDASWYLRRPDQNQLSGADVVQYLQDSRYVRSGRLPNASSLPETVLCPLSSVLRPLSSVLCPPSSVLRPLSSILQPPTSARQLPLLLERVP